MSKLIIIICTIFTLNTTAFFQAPPPPAPPPPRGTKIAPVAVSKTFTSLEGGFKINLLNRVMGYGRLGKKQTADLGLGGLFTFRQSEIDYQIGYIDFASSLNKSEISNKLKNLHEIILEYKLENTTFSNTTFKGNKVTDVKGELGLHHWVRYIQKNDKLFILIAKYYTNEPSRIAKKVFESINFFSAEDMLAERVKNATPPPLPQTPKTNRKTSDAQNQKIKGKVKTVVTYDQDLTGTWYSSDKTLRLEEHFDKSGNLVKRVRYNDKSLPLFITVFGYLDGKRVSKVNSINYSSDPPPPAPAIGSAIKKDNRFSSLYEFKYDDKNRLKEKSVYNNSGQLSYRLVYEYSTNKIVESSYGSTGNFRRKTIETFNEKGNIIKEQWMDSKMKESSPYTYSYEAFDSNGNWTKRIVKRIPTKDENKRIAQHYISYREITYHK